MNRLPSLWVLLGGMLIGAPSVAFAVDGGATDEVLKWNEILINAVRRDNTPPPKASRNMAMVHAAVCEAVNAISKTHTVFRMDIEPPPFASSEAAAAAAAHGVLVQLYPKQQRDFDAELCRSLAEIRDGPAEIEGVQLGRFVADQFVNWRSGDDLVGPATLSPATGSGLWRPTPPEFKPAVLPQWGRVTPFAVKSTRQFSLDPPPSLSSKEYARCFNEVKALGAADSTARTEDETEIAYFWADGPKTCTPPGHWNEIARTVAADRGNTLADNARLFALLNIAMADAAICCWDCKFMYNFWRPITGIRNGDYDNNPETEADLDWTPLLETPAFPAYSSGHSSFSGVAAAVLADFFGTDNIRFTATSDGLPGVKRSYASFSEAADEAGRSRIYGGIHWDCDNVEGLAMGRSLGAYVCRKFLLRQPDASTKVARH